KIILYIISYIFTISEIFIILNFGTRFSLLILQLIAETNPNEASEFISSYIISPKMLMYYFLVVSFIGSNIFSEKSDLIKSITKQIIDYIPNKIYIWISCILLISGATSIYRDIRLLYTFYSKHFKDVPEVLFNVRYSKNYTTLGNIVYASYFYFSSLNETEVLAETLQNLSSINSYFTSKNVILILGESFNKSHSSLYGYSINTNPKLNKDGDNLFLMNHIISPSNATASCLRLLFSFSNRDNDLYWANTPLFPALYRAAGYNVFFLSNQECQGHGKDI
ncbi:MAG: sulfatase-like hydrolase/transferase, partial [Alistipes sp.]|nr:sulfatase-like hydrolase/transferase [Alistipes sp.]